MRRIAATLALVTLATGLAAPACSRAPEAPAAGAQGEGAASRVQRDADGRTTIRLDAREQAESGIETAALQAASMAPETLAYGRVLDAQLLAAAVSERDAARSALGAAERELERDSRLLASQNASARAVESARAAAEQGRIALDAATAKLVAGWGTAIADRDDLDSLARSLVRQDSALVRADLADTKNVRPIAARISHVGEDGDAIEASILGPAPSTDLLFQGRGFLCLVAANASRLVAGDAVAVRLTLAGDTVSGAVVPSAAIVRTHGRAWAYVATSDGEFVRREVSVERPLPPGWFVTAGVAAGDRIVTAGAQMLLSEELKSTIQAAD